jgi:hypothetical protein
LFSSSKPSRLLGGRLSVDFANAALLDTEFSWEKFVSFLEAVSIVSSERGARLLVLTQSNPQAAEALLQKAQRLCASLRKVFTAMIRREKLDREWTDSINDVLRITEGHDELVYESGRWGIEFIAREGGLDWLLAAIAPTPIAACSFTTCLARAGGVGVQCRYAETAAKSPPSHANTHRRASIINRQFPDGWKPT